MAFYAAVHYVNAYLWDRLQVEPANHFERERFIRTVADLRPFASHYTRLQAISRSARYVPGSHVSPEDAMALIDVNLEEVRHVILQVLDADL